MSENQSSNHDGLGKKHKLSNFVIPAEAGIQ